MTSSSASSASSPAAVFVGIDVCKQKLDLARSDSVDQLLTVNNDAAGIGQILQLLRPLKPAVIVLEATGGLERPLLDALLDAQLPVALVNPARVRNFARGLGVLAKTDRIDAAVLVDFARRAAPRLSQKRSNNQVELEALVTCRRQLAHDRAGHAVRRSSTSAKSARCGASMR